MKQFLLVSIAFLLFGRLTMAGEVVFIDKAGKMYHGSTCSLLKEGITETLEVSVARERGHAPCPYCKAQAATPARRYYLPEEPPPASSYSQDSSSEIELERRYLEERIQYLSGGCKERARSPRVQQFCDDAAEGAKRSITSLEQDPEYYFYKQDRKNQAKKRYPSYATDPRTGKQYPHAGGGIYIDPQTGQSVPTSH